MSRNEWLRALGHVLPLGSGRRRRSASRAAANHRRNWTSLQLEDLEQRQLLAVVAGSAASEQAVPLYEKLTAATVGGTVSPLLGSGPTGYTPTQIKQAYGINQISFTGSSGTVAGNGAGETIAIVDAYDDPNIASDLHQFDLAFGLSDPTLTKVNQNGGSSLPSGNTGWATEIALDVEWAHAIAPAANILLVEANSSSLSDLLTAVNYARNASGVVAVSMSWGAGEFSGENSYDSYFTTPSGHNGVAFIVASGDSGAPTDYPGASPNVLGTGGTTLNLNGSNGISSETAWSGSTGGLSAYESQPAYQKGIVTQSSTQRGTPDVAYDANPNTGFPVYDSYGYSSPWGQYGGTSDAAPQWAALVAIADQGRSVAGEAPLTGTQLSTDLYQLPAADFNDTTSGSSTGSPKLSATTGYDLVTGRGSPKANLIIPALVGQTNPAVTTHLSVSAPSGETAGGTFSITVDALNGSNSTTAGYTGTVHFSSSDVAAGLPANYTFTAADAGVHTFTGLVLKTAGSQTIAATDTSTSSITGSATVAVTPAAANHLAFGQQPTSQLIGATISPAVTVKIEDAYNNVLTSDSTDKVTLALGTNPSGATLGGTTTATVSAGTATFSNLSVNLVGSGYTLAASSPATSTGATSSSFNVSANTVVTHLSVSAPSSETAGSTFSITASALNSANAAVAGYTGTVHFSSSDVAAGLPANYTFTAADAGVHTFSGLVLKTAGSRTITATDTSTSSITGSATVAVTPGVATHLAILQQPGSAVVGASISPAVTVAVEDAYNNVVTSDSTDQVTIAMGSNSAGGTLSGTTTATVSGGIATFSNLSIGTVGTGYTLAASSGTLTGIATTSFSVSAVPTSTLIEGFETSSTYNVVGSSSETAYLSSTAAHDGSYGLVDTSGNDWMYRNDSAAQVKQGESISVWVQFTSTSSARAYFGFGASASGTLSIVAAPNTGQLILQSNSGYGYTNLAVANQTYTAGTWYRLQVNWGTGGAITGQLYASNGTTLLSSVTTTDNAITSGGIAFRAIGAGNAYFDTVTESPLSGSSAKTSAIATSGTSTSPVSTSGVFTSGGLSGAWPAPFPWFGGISPAVSASPAASAAPVSSLGADPALAAASASSLLSSLEETLLEEATLQSIAQARVRGF